jgi:hypothetical protein
VEQRLAESARRRQEAEARRTGAVRQKIEAEQLLAASIEQRKQLAQETAALRAQRTVDSTALRELRTGRYIQSVSAFLQRVRSFPKPPLIAALLAVGVVAFVSNLPRSQQTAVASARAGATVHDRSSNLVLKMDGELSGLVARARSKRPVR